MDILFLSVAIRWLIGWALVYRLPQLPDLQVIGEPKVSVLIPARNEEKNLPKLLAAIATQTFQPHQVIVIDDQSTDSTAAIAHSTGVQVIQTQVLPPGWTGKNWALQTGYEIASGEILIFLDADTEPQPEFLNRLVANVQHLGGLVSVQPYHRTERPYELLAILFNLVGLMAVRLGPNGGVAFGPAMATTRQDYERVGGHHAVSGYVVEDWFIAHLYEKEGLPASAYLGDDQLSYRMYPGGISDLIVGFNKNFATAAGQVSWIKMLGVVLWLSGLFWAAWCLPATLLNWPVAGNPSLLHSAVIYIAFMTQLAFIVRKVGSFGWISTVFPIPVIFFIGVFLWAILNLERGEIEWKERKISTRWRGG